MAHERTYLRDQLASSMSEYKTKLEEAHAVATKKKRFFQSNKHRDHESQSQRDFEDFSVRISGILDSLDKHVAVDNPPSGKLINIDSLGLL